MFCIKFSLQNDEELVNSSRQLFSENFDHFRNSTVPASTVLCFLKSNFQGLT